MVCSLIVLIFSSKNVSLFYLGNRAQSEDRFRVSTLSLSNVPIDSTSHTHLPSYAAHTSSSMSKFRDGNQSSTPPPVVPLGIPSSSSSNVSINNPSQSRRMAPVISTKNMTKSRSTQNLILPTNSIQQSKGNPMRRIKISRVTRRPPTLPTTCQVPSTSTSSSSASSNASSPTKSLQTKENDQTQQYHHHPPPPSSSSSSSLPLRQLDNTSNDLMPRWAQDCFYRTVVLGLKPLLLHDIPASPNKPPQRSSSTCSIESTDSLETASEFQACSLNDTQAKDSPVRRSISIPDYRQMKQTNLVLPSSLAEINVKEDESMTNDDRMPMINHLVDDLHKRLNELESLYSTVRQSFPPFLFISIQWMIFLGLSKFRCSRFDLKAIY